MLARPRGLAPAAWGLFGLGVLALAGVAVLDAGLRAAGRADVAVMVPANYPPLFAALSTSAVGAVVASRRPRHPNGWLLLGLGLALAATALGMACVNAAVAGTGPAWGGGAAPYLPLLITGAVAVNAVVFLLTPSGRLPSARWRPLLLVTVAVPIALVLVVTFDRARGRPAPVASPLDLGALGALAAVAVKAGFVLCEVAFFAAAASVVARFRVARGLERQQLRLVLLVTGVVLALSAVLVGLVLAHAYVLAGLVGGLCPALIAVAIGAAVLRYRLYDLDRLVSRTVAYGLVTVALGGAYAVVVLGLGQLVGSGSSLVVAAATLTVAAAFQPLLRRVREAVDRRFDRRRYDGARTVAAFSARLRDQVDLDGLTGRLLGVVEQTMQPASLSLWLRPPGER